MRVLGIDHGQKRVGLALSDATGMLASPLRVLERKSRRKSDIKELAQLIVEQEVRIVVIGVPLEMSGAAGPKANEVRQFADALRAATRVPVYEWDERLTTVQAEAALRAGGASAKRRRDLIDQVAASIILQAWLDAHRGSFEELAGVGGPTEDQA